VRDQKEWEKVTLVAFSGMKTKTDRASKELFNAIDDNNTAKVETLISATNVNVRDREGASPLMRAAVVANYDNGIKGWRCNLKQAQYNIDLEIDGQEFPSELVHCLHQRDPFPGGHIYKLRIRSPAARRFFPNIEGGFYENPNREICASVFRAIEALLLARQGERRVGSPGSEVLPELYRESYCQR